MNESRLQVHQRGYIGQGQLRKKAGERKYIALHLREDCHMLRHPALEVPREYWTQLSLCSHCSLAASVRWYPDEWITSGFSSWWRGRQEAIGA